MMPSSGLYVDLLSRKECKFVRGTYVREDSVCRDGLAKQRRQSLRFSAHSCSFSHSSINDSISLSARM